MRVGEVTMLQRHARLGNYEVMDLLGHGGMSLVYKARSLKDGTPVALKVPDSQLLSSPGALRQFSREGNSLVRLAHPNIVKVHACGQQNGLPYIVMEYVDGSPLTETMKVRGAFPVEDIACMLRPVAQALDYVHTQDIVHRDVKPGNIRLTRGGVPILVDFGIVQTAEATVWDDGKPRGSVWYMSPEQASGQRASGSSDQYSLAVVAYEMLAGHVPFDGDNPYAIVLQQRDSKPDLSSSWSPPVRAVMQKALEKDPRKRFSSCTEFVESLGNAGHGHYPPELPADNTAALLNRQITAEKSRRAVSSGAVVRTGAVTKRSGASSVAIASVTTLIGLLLIVAIAHWFITSRQPTEVANMHNLAVSGPNRPTDQSQPPTGVHTGSSARVTAPVQPENERAVMTPQPPSVEEFTADSARVRSGRDVRLTWSVTGNVRSVRLVPGGDVPKSATGFVVRPMATTDFTLIARGTTTTVEKTLTIEVIPEITVTNETRRAVIVWIAPGGKDETLQPGTAQLQPPANPHELCWRYAGTRTGAITCQAYAATVVIKDEDERLWKDALSKSALVEATNGTLLESRAITQPTEVPVDSGPEARRVFIDAQSELAARKYDEAAALFGRAARLNPTWSEPLVERAKLDVKLGRFTEAIEDSTQALRLNPNDASALNLRGYARYSVNRIKDAISDFGEALRLKPDYHDAYQNRGNAKWALGDKEGANEDYTMARSLEKKR